MFPESASRPQRGVTERSQGLISTTASSFPPSSSKEMWRISHQAGDLQLRLHPINVTFQKCNCLPDHVGWDGSVVGTAQNVSDEHLVAAFADPQIENLQGK